MIPSRFGVVQDSDLTNSVKRIISAGTSLKASIFKYVITDADINKATAQNYLSSVNNVISLWSDYADKLHDTMKDTDAVEGPMAIKYDTVKDYFYASYDYASVLPFADGVLKGITSGKFEKSKDIEGFMRHTVDEAFDDRAETTAGLLDEVLQLSEMDNATRATNQEAKLFNAVARQKLFDRSDAREMYQALEKTVEYLTGNINKDYNLRKYETKLLVSMVNNVVEYMTYTVTAYATRIYAIAKYAYPYITANASKYTESCEMNFNPAGAMKAECGSMMITADEIKFTNITDFEYMNSTLHAFLRDIEAADDVDNPSRDYSIASYRAYDNTACSSNAFMSKLLANPLREYLERKLRRDIFGANEKSILAARDTLKSYISNSTQAVEYSTTAKQGILHVIRGVDAEKPTIEGYRELAKDLVICSENITGGISRMYDDLMRYRRQEDNFPIYNNSVLTATAEILKLLSALYRDITSAILSKARDIEAKYKDLKNDKLEDTMNDLKIKIPGGEKSDLDSNHNMMTSVPNTTRMPVELTDLYSLPSFESLQMYDEYVKTLPGMEGDPYYEAVNRSQLINAIMSFLEGIKKRWNQFFTDKYFQRAVQWAKDHQQAMNQMTFTPPMEVVPYSKDTTISHIDKLINTLNGFNADALKGEDKLDAFIKSLYNGGDNDLLAIFDVSKTKSDQAAKAYANWVLFKNTTDPQPKNLNTNEDIHKEMEIWFDNVVNSSGTHQSLIEKSKALDTAMNSFKSKIAGVKVTNSNDAAAQKTETPPAMTGGNAANKPGTGARGSAPVNNAATSNTNTSVNAANDLADIALTRVQTAINQLWGNLYGVVTGSIKTQYKYIQEAFSKGRGPQQHV